MERNIRKRFNGPQKEWHISHVKGAENRWFFSSVRTFLSVDRNTGSGFSTPRASKGRLCGPLKKTSYAPLRR
jgi:hypothetical protein